MRLPSLTAEQRAERAVAYRMVSRALRSGALVRPATCDNCHRDRPQAHHHWGYAGHELDVMWLCSPCHTQLHATGRCPVPEPDIVKLARAVIAKWQLGIAISDDEARRLRAVLVEASVPKEASA